MKVVQREANRERWHAAVEAWRTSGKQLSAWARERNISRDALEYWKRQFPAKKVLPTIVSRPLTLIPLRPTVPAASAAPIELAVEPSGYRIRLPVTFDAGSLTRLLDILEARC